MKFGDFSNELMDSQKILQSLGYYTLSIDGIYGAGSQRAILAYQYKNGLQNTGLLDAETQKSIFSETIQDDSELFSTEAILSVIKNKGYVLREGKFQINLIGLRIGGYDNQFTEKLFVLWKNEKNEWEKREFKWTTVAGTEGQGFKNPITVLGVTGTAVLKEGQYLNTYTFVDDYNGWLNYPYFYQTGTVTVYRDGNRDSDLEYDAPQQAGLFGINLHRMSNNGVDSNTVNSAYASWSIGCQGAPEPTFAQIVELARVTARLYGNVFDYTLINKTDFNN